MKKDRMSAIIFNVWLIILELCGLLTSITTNGYLDVQYYTLDSNIFALIAAIIYLCYLIPNKKIPKFVSILKYSSTLSVMVTFLVVIFILAPMYGFNYGGFLFFGDSLFFHNLCPIFAFISFVFLEVHEIKGLRDNLRAMYFTICYAAIAIILNLLKVLDGPYPFLRVYEQSILMSVLWVIIIVGGAFGFSKLLELLNKGKKNKK